MDQHPSLVVVQVETDENCSSIFFIIGVQVLFIILKHVIVLFFFCVWMRKSLDFVIPRLNIRIFKGQTKIVRLNNFEFIFWQKKLKNYGSISDLSMMYLCGDLLVRVGPCGFSRRLFLTENQKGGEALVSNLGRCWVWKKRGRIGK